MKANLNLKLKIARASGGILTILCLAWIIDVPSFFRVAFYREQLLALVLALALVIVFMNVPLTKRRGLSWLDGCLAALSVCSLSYIAFDYTRLIAEVPNRPAETIVLGAIVILLTLEGLRRTAGYTLFSVVLVFMCYALIGDKIPGELAGRPVSFDWMVVYLSFDPSAAFGIPLAIGSTVVIVFILMGQALFASGGGQFFTDLAMSSMARRRGGAAKIAVVASALFGSISGAAVSNVVSTGVMTIPMMIRSGYSRINAGAIEAVASTGGQLMPPIMGAAAFLMAEFLDIPYAEVMLAAIIPSALYYFAIFIQVDLIAGRNGIRPLDDALPKVRDTIAEGWHFILPFGVLLFFLFVEKDDPEVAALYASAAIIVIGMIKSYRESRLSLRNVVLLLPETALVTADLFIILAAAGFIIGILNMTGLGFTLTFILVQLGADSLILLLVISAGVCIILGMGMPTSGVYVLLAALVAPSLVEVGIKPLAAHMFILYFGMMSMITPPIALAAFAAATISKGAAMETGWSSMRLGWVAYIVPFLFVFSPTLLLLGTPAEIVLNATTAFVGVFYVTVSVAGYFFRSINGLTRCVLGLAGIGAMTPDAIIGGAGLIDAAGSLVGAAVLAWQYLVRKRGAA